MKGFFCNQLSCFLSIFASRNTKRVIPFIVPSFYLNCVMKQMMIKAIAAALFMLVVVVLTLCLSSCDSSVYIKKETKSENAEQSVMRLDLSTTQGSVYSGYRGALSVYSSGERIEKMLLSGDDGYQMTTDYSYLSDDNSMVVEQRSNGNHPSSYQTVVQFSSDGIPSSFICVDQLTGQTTGQGNVDFSFRITGELSQVHIQRGHREIFLDYLYGDSEEDKALCWASFWPDAMINTFCDCKGLGEYVALLGLNHSLGKRIQQINVTEIFEDERYLGEVLVFAETENSIRIESRVISTDYTYGNAQSWIDKNLDAAKWYAVVQ